MKWGFVTFAVRIMMKSYSSVYGPLGLVPLVLVWIYTSWLLVLLGAEIAHALQNLRLLEAEDRRQRDDEPINGLLAAQLLAAVAATHEVGGAGHPKERLVTEFGLTPDNVERVVARLKQRGLIAEVRGDINGYIPARPAASIRLDEVLSAFRSSDIEIAHGATAPAFAKLVDELEEARRRRIAGVTIAELMPPQPARTPATMTATRDQAAGRPSGPEEGLRLPAYMRQRSRSTRGRSIRGARRGRRPRRRGWSRRTPQPAPAIAVVSPHAGWMYSGALAGKLFAGVAVPERVLVIAPNHTGHGPRASVWSADDGAASSWRLPGPGRAGRRGVRRGAAGGGAALERRSRGA